MAKRRLIGLLALVALGMLAAGCAGPSVAVGSAPTGPVAFTPAPGPQVSGTWRGVFYEVASHRTSKVLEGQMVLRINDDGTGPPRVVTVGTDGKVRFQVVQLGRDFGTTVEVVGGLSERDRLLVTPPDTLQEGAVVRMPASPTGFGPPRMRRMWI
jgi:hypothetical protein